MVGCSALEQVAYEGRVLHIRLLRHHGERVRGHGRISKWLRLLIQNVLHQLLVHSFWRFIDLGGLRCQRRPVLHVQNHLLNGRDVLRLLR